MTRPIRRLSALVAAGALALSLSGCDSHPGDAARVGSSAIDTGRLDRVATALCSAQASSPGAGEQSSRSNRELALGVLIDSHLSTAYAKAVGVTPSRAQLEQAATARQQLIDSVPAKYRPTLTATLRGLDRSQLTMAEVGRRALVKSGATNVTAQTAIPAGLKLRDAWVKKHLHVTVDPRFGTFTGGQLKARSGSLSAPVSSQAVAGAKTQPPSSWLSSLPPSQKCS